MSSFLLIFCLSILSTSAPSSTCFTSCKSLSKMPVTVATDYASFIKSRCVNLRNLFKLNFIRHCQYVGFIFVSALLMDYTEYLFENTYRVILNHNILDFYGVVPESTIQKLYAIFLSVGICMQFPVQVALKSTIIFGLSGFVLVPFRDVSYIFFSITTFILILVLMNGLGFCNYYRDDIARGFYRTHAAFYWSFGTAFFVVSCHSYISSFINTF